MTSATTRKVLKLMPPAGEKISLVSTAGAAGMRPLFAPLIEILLGVHCLGLVSVLKEPNSFVPQEKPMRLTLKLQEKQ